MEKLHQNERGMIAWALNNRAFPIAVVVILTAIGLLGLVEMPRNEFPPITPRQALMTVVYPGASSNEVEEQVSRPLERQLFSFNDVNKHKTQSFSRNGSSIVSIELYENVKGHSIEAFWNKLRGSMLGFGADLPNGVVGPFLQSDFGETATMLLAVRSDKMEYRELSEQVDYIESKLNELKGLGKITRVGELKEELLVKLDPERMRECHVGLEQVIACLKAETELVSGGTIDDGQLNRPIQIKPEKLAEVAMGMRIVRIAQSGALIRLKDVAQFEKRYPENEPYTTVRGFPCVILALEMTKGGNIVSFGEQAETKLKEIRAKLPEEVTVTELASQPEVVREAINLFLREFLYTLISVVVITMLLLPFRVALVAAATIPLSIASTVAVMYMLGFELNTVTLAALILVLGIVVDDAIVVIDGYLDNLEKYHPPYAALLAASSMLRSVFIATLVIGATFIPLMFFLTGMAADFIGQFPFTIIIALGFSFGIAMLIVPYSCARLITSQLPMNPNIFGRETLLNRIQNFFDRMIRWSMAHPRLVVFIGAGCVAGGGVLMALLPLQLFPKVARAQFAIEIYLDQGSTIKETRTAVNKMEEILSGDDRVALFASSIGGSLPRFHPVYAPNIPASNYAQILVNTVSERATEEIISQYEKEYSWSLPNGYMRMKQLTMVSAVAPIEIRLSGPQIEELKWVSAEIANLAKDIPGVQWARTDYEQMQEVLNLQIDPVASLSAGVDRNMLGKLLSLSTDGAPVAQVWEESYRLPVRIRSGEKGRDLKDIRVPLPGGTGSIPLQQLAQVATEKHEGKIVHRNGNRTLTLRIDLRQGIYSGDVLGKLRPKISAIDIPSTVSVAYGGEQELQDENMVQMLKSLGVSIAIIFLCLLWYFKRVSLALLAMATMPLSVPGVGLGLTIMGCEFGFTAFIGMFALIALVVRNGMILIELAESLRRTRALTPIQAGLMAASRRLRPIFLTSIATSVGVITMVCGDSPLWLPLGVVICFGVLEAMFLTVLVLPALYALCISSRNEVRVSDLEKFVS